MRARVAVPWLRDAWRGAAGGTSPPECPSLRWLVTHTIARREVTTSWRAWLLEGSTIGADVLARHAAGPCLAALLGQDATARAWACAEPVHIVAAIDHLRLAAPGRVELDQSETDELAGAIAEQLEGSGFVLADTSEPVWLLRCPDAFVVDCPEPSEVAGRDLRSFLPTGPDAVRLQSVVNELQMRLHEHPVNERRLEAGRPEANSLWIWGMGAAAPTAQVGLEPLATDDVWLRGLWARHGQHADVMDTAHLALRRDPVAALIAQSSPPSSSPGEALRIAEAGMLTELRHAFEQRRLAEILVLAGDVELTIRRRRRWSLWHRPVSLDEVFG
jgi:hypothetical protein